jgi:Domain of unknown function (DUF5666)
MNPYETVSEHARNVPEYAEHAEHAPPPLAPAPHRRHWLVPGLLAAAFLLTLALGAFAGATMLKTAQAAGNNPANGNNANTAFQLPFASTPGAGSGQHGPGQCDAYTVSSVSGATITAKAADGSTVTIHTSLSTKYTKAGQSASASAVSVGSQIHVQGTKNSDGSISATQIDVR